METVLILLASVAMLVGPALLAPVSLNEDEEWIESASYRGYRCRMCGATL